MPLWVQWADYSDPTVGSCVTGRVLSYFPTIVPYCKDHFNVSAESWYGLLQVLSVYISPVRTHMLVASLLTACFKDSNCTSRFSFSEVPFIFHSAEIRMCFRESYSTIFAWDFCLWWDQDVPHSVFYTWVMYLYYHISVIFIWLYIKRRRIFRLCPKTTRSWLWPIPSSLFRRLCLQQNTSGTAPRAVGTHRSCHHDWRLI